MINLITAANGKLDDPIMQEWAINFYRHLPINAHAERNQIETEWFHELFIVQLCDRGDTSVLSQFFRELPPQHFSNCTHLLVKHWAAWPASVSLSAAHILAVNAPAELLRLYQQHLELFKTGNIDPFKFSVIDQLSSQSKNSIFNELIDEFAQIVLALDNDFMQSSLLHSVLKLSKLLPADILAALVDKALKIETSDNRRQSHLLSLFKGIFGHNEYLAMVLDREHYDSPLRLSTLQPFFVDSAPLQKLDEWLINLPPKAEVVSLLEMVGKESENCRILLALLKDSTKLTEKTQTQLAMAACLQALAKDTLDTSGFDLTTTVNLLAVDLEFVRWNSELIDHLKNFDSAPVSEQLILRLQENSGDYAAVHIAEAMGELKYPEFINPLINATSEKKGDFLCDAAQNALCEMGRSAQAAIIEQWEDLDSSQQIFGQSVIRNVHGAAANDFAVSRFSELCSFDIELACELILAAPDPRLIELLEPELRRKQPIIDRAFYIAAKLLDYAGPELDSAKDRALNDHLRSKNAQAAMETGSLPQSEFLALELKCPSCDAVNQYQTKGVVVAAEENVSPLLADEFPCLSCGKEVDFIFTATAQMAITAELLKKSIANDKDQPLESKVKAIDCKVEGQVIPLSKALSVINKNLAAQPKNAVQWLRLGNLLFQLNRSKAALNAYQKAVKYSPYAADAQFALASAYYDNQQEVEAFQVMQDAFKRVSKWTFLSEFPDFSHEFADLYNHLRRSLGKLDVPAVHPSALMRPKKLGRNDPCACGSGKKYKKCCGR